MRDELLAYLLNDLDPQQRQRIEQRLEHDPVWQEELERLRSCLDAYEGEPATSRPPGDLVDRTCSLVEHATDKQCHATYPMPGDPTPGAGAPLTESRDLQVGGSRWSMSDLVVGTVVLLAVAMLVLPALRKSRDAARHAKCQDNLRQLGTALVQYAERGDQGLPHIDVDENAGSFVIDLAESGLLHPDQLVMLLVCPSSPLADDVFSGRVVMRVPTRQDLRTPSQALLAKMRRFMAGSYAYRLGFQDEQGQYRQVKYVGRSDAPMLADAPSFLVAGFQSANHGGCGQYVVFQDLSSRYFKDCVSADRSDHLFLNADRQQAAGRHAEDVVLGSSEVGPTGPLAAAR